MKRYTLLLLIVGICSYSMTSAQYGYYYRSPRRYRRPPVHENLPPFTPSINLSFGYGFPNLDKDQLLEFYNYGMGGTNQTGPIHAAIDYQFSRFNSIGVMVSYGKVSAPYYDYNAPSSPAFYGKLEDWSVMLNLVRYMPVGRVVSPYLRTAIGVSIWNQSYLDPSGNKFIQAEDPGAFTYQVSLGTKINLTDQSGLFIEAGYGKYILSGGLSFKF